MPPLLAQCWTYLEGFFSHSLGFNSEKIRWIYDKAPWINELKHLSTDSFTQINNDLEIKFLSNDQNGSIYEKLFQIIGEREIQLLTIVSPYFDKTGKALLNFLEDYELEKVECLTDSQSGLLPIELPSAYLSRFSFFEWSDCIKGFDNSIYRLHAKLFDFKLIDGTEYLLIGSCNATTSALGSLLIPPTNTESAILLKRYSNTSFLGELGISTLNVKPISLKSSRNHFFKPPEASASLKHHCKILHVEKEGNQLVFILNRDLNRQSQLVFRDKNLIITEKQLFDGQREGKIKLTLPEKVEQVFVSQNGIRISNIRPIQDKYLLSKSNPDPSESEINMLIEKISENSDFSSIVSIFKFLDYSESEGEYSTSSVSNRAHPFIGKRVETELDSFSEKEFLEFPSVQSYIRDTINHSNVQLADLIGLLGKGILVKKESFSEDIESSLLGEDLENQNNEENVIKDTEAQVQKGERLKEAILNHLEKIHKSYFSTLEGQLEESDFERNKDEQISLNEISNFVILFGLINEFYGKFYEIDTIEISINYNEKHNQEIKKLERKFSLKKSTKVDKNSLKTSFYYIQRDLIDEFTSQINSISPLLLNRNNEPSSKIFKYSYFSNSSLDNRKKDGIKTILTNTLGLFLFKVAKSGGLKEYGYSTLREKMDFMRTSLFEFASILILRAEWLERELEVRDLLLLDLFHFFLPDSFNANEIRSKLENHGRDKGFSIFDSMNGYFNQALEDYEKWKSKLNNDTGSLIEQKTEVNHNSIIYKSKIGFALIGHTKSEDLHLRKPAFRRFLDGNNFYKINSPLSKVVLFKKE